jgi:hypothetical protein
MRTVALLLIGLAGCGTSQSSKEALADALHEYSRGIRWGRSEWIQSHLPRGQEARLASAQLQVTGCEIESVYMKSKSEAYATVRVDWYLLDQGRLHSSLLRQSWVESGGRWEIREQRVTQGAPFPGLGQTGVRPL